MFFTIIYFYNVTHRRVAPYNILFVRDRNDDNSKLLCWFLHLMEISDYLLFLRTIEQMEHCDCQESKCSFLQLDFFFGRSAAAAV